MRTIIAALILSCGTQLHAQRLHVDSTGVHIIFTLKESTELLRWSSELEQMTDLAEKQRRAISLLEKDVKLCDEQKSIVVIQRDTVYKEVEQQTQAHAVMLKEQTSLARNNYDLTLKVRSQKKIIIALGVTTSALLYAIIRKD